MVTATRSKKELTFDAFVERVAKNNSWNNGDRYSIEKRVDFGLVNRGHLLGDLAAVI